MLKTYAQFVLLNTAMLAVSGSVLAQDRADERGRPGAEQAGGRGFGGFRGPGPMGGVQAKILEKFDEDQSGWLNLEERTKAREFLASDEGKKTRQAADLVVSDQADVVVSVLVALADLAQAVLLPRVLVDLAQAVLIWPRRS